MQTSLTWKSIDVFVVGISGTPGFSEADNLKSKANFGYKCFWIFKVFVQASIFMCKIEKESFSEELNSTVMFLV